MKKLFLLAITLLWNANMGLSKDETYSPWLSSVSYQNLVDKNVANGLFIEKVEGRAAQPRDEFRAVFVALPEYTRGWYSHHGLTEKEGSSARSVYGSCQGG